MVTLAGELVVSNAMLVLVLLAYRDALRSLSKCRPQSETAPNPLRLRRSLGMAQVCLWWGFAVVAKTAVILLQIHLGLYPGHRFDLWDLLQKAAWVPVLMVAARYFVSDFVRWRTAHARPE